MLTICLFTHLGAGALDTGGNLWPHGIYLLDRSQISKLLYQKVRKIQENKVRMEYCLMAFISPGEIEATRKF